MPLDPSIFFQAAALRQAAANRRQAIVENAFDRLAKQQMLAQGIALEDKRRAEDFAQQKELIDYRLKNSPEYQQRAAIESALRARGVSAEEMPIAIQSLMNPPGTRYQPDEAGNVRAITPPSLYEQIYGKQMSFGAQPGQQTAPVSALDVLTQSQTPPPAAAPQTDLEKYYGQGPTLDGLPPIGIYAGSPKQQVKSGETAIELEKAKQEADIKASQKGAETQATKEAEERVSKGSRIDALNELRDGINKLREDIKGTPSGVIEGAAATATELVGRPSKKAINRAKLASGKAIAGLQARISFLKGQGTITDREAEQAMAFLPALNDPDEIKLAKLDGAVEYLDMLTGKGKPETPTGPGYRYIGVKK